MRNPKQPLSLAFVGCIWLAFVFGCKAPWGNSNSGQRPSPGASPANTTETSSSPRSPNAANSPTGTADAAGVTRANFDRLQTGMTYAEAVQILGKEGELQEFGKKATGSLKIEMYKWKGTGGNSELTVFFKDEKLDSKLQFGL